MANTTITPNMNLIVPTVGVDPGPDWASNLNGSLTIIDSHNHGSGSGVQITPNGLNINSDLTFNSNNAISLNSVRFTPLSSPIAGTAPNLGCLYESGVDLYYNDGSGNQVRITQSGGVAGAAGSISGLTSPASATYVSGTQTFVWQSAANTAANMDGGSIILRNITSGSNGITIAPPAGLSSSFTFTLPGSLPASTSFVTVDNAGNMATSISTTAGITGSMIAANTVTVGNLAAYTGQQVSGLCGSFSVSPGPTTPVTNLNVTLTTKGGPVIVGLTGYSGTLTSFWECTSPTGVCNLLIYENNTNILATYTLHVPTSANDIVTAAPSTLIFYVPTAGTYTWTVYMNTNTAGYLYNYALYAYEL